MLRSTMALLFAILLLVCGTTTVLSISLTDRATSSNKNLLPASRLVEFTLYNVQDSYDCLEFEQSHLPSSSKDAFFSSLLRRRDGLSIYGKDIIHGPEEPNYATLSLLPLTDDHNGIDTTGTCNWEATMLLTPEHHHEYSLDDSCFVAMNRFAVKEGCEHLFEERWAERESKLPQQHGFLSFCLIRKRNTVGNEKQESLKVSAPFNYSSLTLWESFEAWKSWRNGDGRYSHDVSRTAKRTPVREWLEYPASPVFWDSKGSNIAESGV